MVGACSARAWLVLLCTLSLHSSFRTPSSTLNQGVSIATFSWIGVDALRVRSLFQPTNTATFVESNFVTTSTPSSCSRTPLMRTSGGLCLSNETPPSPFTSTVPPKPHDFAHNSMWFTPSPTVSDPTLNGGCGDSEPLSQHQLESTSTSSPCDCSVQPQYGTFHTPWPSPSMPEPRTLGRLFPVTTKTTRGFDIVHGGNTWTGNVTSAPSPTDKWTKTFTDLGARNTNISLPIGDVIDFGIPGFDGGFGGLTEDSKRGVVLRSLKTFFKNRSGPDDGDLMQIFRSLYEALQSGRQLSTEENEELQSLGKIVMELATVGKLAFVQSRRGGHGKDWIVNTKDADAAAQQDYLDIVSSLRAMVRAGLMRSSAPQKYLQSLEHVFETAFTIQSATLGMIPWLFDGNFSVAQDLAVLNTEIVNHANLTTQTIGNMSVTAIDPEAIRQIAYEESDMDEHNLRIFTAILAAFDTPLGEILGSKRKAWIEIARLTNAETQLAIRKAEDLFVKFELDSYKRLVPTVVRERAKQFLPRFRSAWESYLRELSGRPLEMQAALKRVYQLAGVAKEKEDAFKRVLWALGSHALLLRSSSNEIARAAAVDVPMDEVNRVFSQVLDGTLSIPKNCVDYPFGQGINLDGTPAILEDEDEGGAQTSALHKEVSKGTHRRESDDDEDDDTPAFPVPNPDALLKDVLEVLSIEEIAVISAYMFLGPLEEFLRDYERDYASAVRQRIRRGRSVDHKLIDQSCKFKINELELEMNRFLTATFPALAKNAKKREMVDKLIQNEVELALSHPELKSVFGYTLLSDVVKSIRKQLHSLRNKYLLEYHKLWASFVKDRAQDEVFDYVKIDRAVKFAIKLDETKEEVTDTIRDEYSEWIDLLMESSSEGIRKQEEDLSELQKLAVETGDPSVLQATPEETGHSQLEASKRIWSRLDLKNQTDIDELLWSFVETIGATVDREISAVLGQHVPLTPATRVEIVESVKWDVETFISDFRNQYWEVTKRKRNKLEDTDDASVLKTTKDSSGFWTLSEELSGKVRRKYGMDSTWKHQWKAFAEVLYPEDQRKCNCRIKPSHAKADKGIGLLADAAGSLSLKLPNLPWSGSVSLQGHIGAWDTSQCFGLGDLLGAAAQGAKSLLKKKPFQFLHRGDKRIPMPLRASKRTIPRPVVSKRVLSSFVQLSSFHSSTIDGTSYARNDTVVGSLGISTNRTNMFMNATSSVDRSDMNATFSGKFSSTYFVSNTSSAYYVNGTFAVSRNETFPGNRTVSSNTKATLKERMRVSTSTSTNSSSRVQQELFEKVILPNVSEQSVAAPYSLCYLPITEPWETAARVALNKEIDDMVRSQVDQSLGVTLFVTPDILKRIEKTISITETTLSTAGSANDTDLTKGLTEENKKLVIKEVMATIAKDKNIVRRTKSVTWPRRDFAWDGLEALVTHQVEERLKLKKAAAKSDKKSQQSQMGQFTQESPSGSNFNHVPS